MDLESKEVKELKKTINTLVVKYKRTTNKMSQADKSQLVRELIRYLDERILSEKSDKQFLSRNAVKSEMGKTQSGQP